ncbi:TonB-dependent receptor plug domain-containing protein [Caulobacter segnis]
MSVISQESYISRQALALDDMLRDAPGVYAQRKWGGDIRISIRGSGDPATPSTTAACC